MPNWNQKQNIGKSGDLKGNEMSGYGAAADDAIPRLT